MKVSGLVKDAKTDAPLPGATVSLYVGEDELAVIPSDDNGEFEHSVKDSYIGQILTCQVEKQGYEKQKVTRELKSEGVHLEIELVPEEKIKPVGWWEKLLKWLKQNKIVVGVIGIVVALIVAAIIIRLLWSTQVPTIRGFNADPGQIATGQSSTLSWQTSNADQVRIEPGVGPVNASGSRSVSPSRTITYTLVARNKDGQVEKTCEIKVAVEPQRLPDLIIESLTHSPVNPTTLDTITFTAVVKNVGSGSAGPSTLALKVGGETNPKTYSVPALSQGKTYGIQRKEVLGVAQNYRNTATADFRNQVRESNENNNQKTDDYQVSLPVVQRLPDLIIESLTHSPAIPTTLDTITFTAVVQNVGSGSAEPSTLALKVGGETNPKTYPVPALSPGQTYGIQRKEVLDVAQNYRNTATADFRNQVRESNENNNQKTDDYQVRVGVPSVFSHGTVVIRGTWSCDLDLGKETQTEADFFWRQRTDTIRSVVPRNGARFYVLGRRDFDSISYNDLTRLSYSSAEIDGSDNASNQIPQGTVVAAITSQGRYCKFRIDAYGYNLRISWVTYAKAR